MDGRFRNPVIDAARGLTMALVVYAHALEIFTTGGADGRGNHLAFEFWRMIFAFHMPAFYFVSGLVSENFAARPPSKMLAAAMSLILLADITHLAVAPLQAVALLHQGNPLGIAAWQILSPLVLGQDFNLIVTWFLVSLAFVQIFAWIYLHARPAVRWLIWALLAGLYFAFQQTGQQIFQFSTWGAGLVFFLMGHAVARKGLWIKEGAGVSAGASPTGLWHSSARHFLIGCAAAAAVFILYPFNHGCSVTPNEFCHLYRGTHLFAVLFVDGQLGFLPLFFLTAALGIVAVTAFAKAIQGTVMAGPTAWVGRNTLPILILNGFILVFVQHRLATRFAFQNSQVAALAWALALTVLQLAALAVVKPGVDWLYGQCRLLSQAIVSRFGTVPSEASRNLGR